MTSLGVPTNHISTKSKFSPRIHSQVLTSQKSPPNILSLMSPILFLLKMAASWSEMFPPAPVWTETDMTSQAGRVFLSKFSFSGHCFLFLISSELLPPPPLNIL